MELDLEKEFADRAYPLLASLVTPRPIALVTTLSADGSVNAAPFSFFNLLGANPPICAFAPGDRDNGTPKDTALNVRATHEFVVNLVDETIAEAMNQCAASLPYGENELVRAGLTAAPSGLLPQPAVLSTAAAGLSGGCKFSRVQKQRRHMSLLCVSIQICRILRPFGFDFSY